MAGAAKASKVGSAGFPCTVEITECFSLGAGNAKSLQVLKAFKILLLADHHPTHPPTIVTRTPEACNSFFPSVNVIF